MTNQEAIDILKCDISADKQGIEYCHDEVGIEALDMAIKALEQEPKTGHWKGKELINPEYIHQDRKIIVCSECNFGMIQGILGYTNYCPNCGAIMVKPDEGYANDWIGYSR